MDELKRAFEAAYKCTDQIQEKIGLGVFLSEADLSALSGALDSLRREQERIEHQLKTSDILPDGEMSIQTVEELFLSQAQHREDEAQARKLADRFLSIQSLDEAYQVLLAPFQRRLSDCEPSTLVELYQNGELEPYRRLIECVEMKEPTHSDVLPLADFYGHHLAFGILGRQLYFPEDAPSTAAEEAPPEETPSEAGRRPEPSQAVPPMTALEDFGDLAREQGTKQPKGVKALLNLCGSEWELKHMLLIVNELVNFYLFLPELQYVTDPGLDRAALDKALSLLLREGYLIRYTLDRYPGITMYGATQAGSQIFQKDAFRRYIVRDAAPFKGRRMDNAADFIRRCEGRLYFSRMFAKDHPVAATYTENIASSVIELRRTDDEPLLGLILPAAIFTRDDAEASLDDLLQTLKKALENTAPDLTVFLASGTREQAAGWEDYLRSQLSFPDQTRFLHGVIGEDSYEDRTGEAQSLASYIQELMDKYRNSGAPVEETPAPEEESFALEEETPALGEEPFALEEETPALEEEPFALEEETPALEEETPAWEEKSSAWEENTIGTEGENEKTSGQESPDSDAAPVEPPVPSRAPKPPVSRRKLPPVIISPSRKSAEAGDGTDMRQEAYRLFVKEKYSSALTLARALSRSSPELKAEYRRYAYALDDPALDKQYCYSDLQTVFPDGFGRQAASDALGLAAYLRLFFSKDAMAEPFYMKNCADDLNACLTFRRVSELKDIVYNLQHCFERTQAVFTPEILSSLIDSTNTNSLRNQYQKKAARFLEGRPEETQKRNQRLGDTFKALLGAKSELRSAVQWVQDGNDDQSEHILNWITPFLSRDNLPAGECDDKHLDWDRIEQYVEDAWRSTEGRATRRKNETLKDPARSTIINRVAEAVKLAASWVFLGSSNEEKHLSEDSRSMLNTTRKRIAEAMGKAAPLCADYPAEEPEERAAMSALAETLRTLSDTLSRGPDEDARRYFYLDFLMDNRLEMTEDYIPFLDEDFSEISPMNLCRRIIKHSRTGTMPWPEVIQRIFEDAEAGCDFGHAELIRNYLLVAEPEYQWPAAYTFPNSVEATRKRLDDEDRNFQARLDLAANYGWIDDTRMIDMILADMERRREHCMATQNFGFYFRTAQAYLKMIQQEAESRRNLYLSRLEELRVEKGDWPIFSEVERLISQQMYTVAQDYMDQAQNSNRREVPVSTYLVSNSDAFSKFLHQYTTLHNDARNAATTSIVQLYTRRHRDMSIARTGEAMLARWPRSPGRDMCKPLEELFRYMNLPVRRVSRTEQTNHYIMEFEGGVQDVNYPHPIGAYGTEMRSKGLHIFLTFGKRNDNTMNTELQKLMTASLNGPAIVLADTALSLADRRSLAQILKSQSQTSTYIVLDRVLLFYLAEFPQLERWNILLRCALPFHYYNPYTESSIVELCPEMFIGRQDELNSIISHGGANIVYGGRQLGKTALLQRAKKLKDVREKGQWAFYLDIRDREVDSTAQLIYHMLIDDHFLEEPADGGEDHITWDSLTRKIIRRINDQANPVENLLLLLDEADTFLQSCGESDCNYAPISCFKRIQQSSGNRFKFVLAGLHKVMRFYKQASQDNDSPIPHLATITMLPLPFHEARELVELPLSYLGFKIQPENEHLIAQILSSTNYFPGLIQYYCSSLVRAVNRDYQGDVNERPPYWLKEAQILTLLKDREFQDNIREKYEITLGVDDMEQGYYNALAYSLARCHFDLPEDIALGYTAEDIRNVCRELDIYSIAKLSLDQVDELLKELIELNILRSRDTDGETRYIFNRASFRHMLGDENQVDDKLAEIMEKEAAVHVS